MKYLYPKDEARRFHKFGVDITGYNEQVASNNIVYEECEVGHLEEFSEEVSTHMWFVISGELTFVLDDEKVVAKAGDLVVVPPKVRIHYFGKAKMLLCTTPAFDPKNERHIRDVDPAESPYVR